MRVEAAGRGRAGGVLGAGLAVGLATIVALGGAACASTGSGGSGASGGEGPLGSASPEDAIQSFLNAANRDDYRAMTRLFGSTAGPALERMEATEVEQRMFVLASLLEHDNYALRRSGLTEGPNEIRFSVDMTGTRNGNVTVPFIVATHGGRWYVQQVVTGPLTGTTG